MMKKKKKKDQIVRTGQTYLYRQTFFLEWRLLRICEGDFNERNYTMMKVNMNKKGENNNKQNSLNFP